MQECGPESARECPYILCGDFNAQPCSPLYNFIVNGKICFTNIRRGDISGQGDSGGPLVSVNLLPEDVEIARNCRFKYLKSKFYTDIYVKSSQYSLFHFMSREREN